MPLKNRLLGIPPKNPAICLQCFYRKQAISQGLQLPWLAFYSTRASRLRSSSSQRNRSNDLARPPSDDELKQYMQGLEELRHGDKGASAGHAVRFFEQNDAGQTELPGEADMQRSIHQGPDSEELNDDLEGLHEEFGTREQQDTFRNVLSELDIDWKAVKSDEDMEAVKHKMAAYRRSIDAQIAEVVSDMPKEMLEAFKSSAPHVFGSDFGEATLPGIPEQPWTPNQRKKVAKLNTAIKHTCRAMKKRPTSVKGTLSRNEVAAIYKAYHGARLALAHGWNSVPITVWEFLWEVFSAEESINPNRLSHIALLARDMSEAKVVLAPEQQILVIEAVFADGWEEKAVDSWKRCVSTLGEENSETFERFWRLGVLLFCRRGDIGQAERAVSKLLDSRADPRILLPLIQTLSSQDAPESHERAWDAYRKMRELLGPDIKLYDYDQVVSYFLASNQTENALFAFVDMMSDGKIDLSRQKYMPSVVANKFFLGKWLKRLIGAGDLTGAFRVVDFMGSKGVYASPIQLNGLIGAWQRAGGSEDFDKADQLAWEMVESRIDFVQARDGVKPATSFGKLSAYGSPPRATLETFSLLAENYRLRGFHQKMEILWQAFRDAKISPDAFMINQLLESFIQSGEWRQAIDMYRTFVTERGVLPDPFTFSALWKTLGVNRLHIIPPEQLGEETASARALFAETIKYKAVFGEEGMDGQLARKILHTFRRLQDNAGFVVALSTLRDHFRFLPPETLVLEIMLGTTKLSWTTPAPRRRLMHAKRDLDRGLLSVAGGDAERLEGTQRGDVLYEYLMSLYAAKCRRQWQVEELDLTDVSKEMTGHI